MINATELQPSMGNTQTTQQHRRAVMTYKRLTTTQYHGLVQNMLATRYVDEQRWATL
jgi:hypothetical protein